MTAVIELQVMVHGTVVICMSFVLAVIYEMEEY